ncbi:hypothetical protein NIES4071_87170 [Calothrix sp. NIES-4071]|nr:hypothetical protein NIES4071_87170 [Calothrix sp. NIES-4071]BAZ62984.1 hypothetical protein NIES4105_87100 [Calothrix sp. NIES-4105]
MQFDNVTCEKVEFAGLPLAVYREIAAHLRQVEGVEVDIVTQSDQQFDYNQSQVECLKLWKAPNLSALDRKIIEQILAYYKKRYET